MNVWYVIVLEFLGQVQIAPRWWNYFDTPLQRTSRPSAWVRVECHHTPSQTPRVGSMILKVWSGHPHYKQCQNVSPHFRQLWFHSLSLKKTALSFRTAPHLHNPRPFACLNLEPPKLLVPSTCCCNILKYFEQPESLKAHHDLFCAVSSRGWCCCPILGWQFWQK